MYDFYNLIPLYLKTTIDENTFKLTAYRISVNQRALKM